MSDKPQPIARGLQWVRQFKRGDKIVWIDVDQLDRSWRADSSLYVGWKITRHGKRSKRMEPMQRAIG